MGCRVSQADHDCCGLKNKYGKSYHENGVCPIITIQDIIKKSKNLNRNQKQNYKKYYYNKPNINYN